MTHYAVTNPKARAPHRCDLCNRTIRPGETYLRGAGLDGSCAWTWRECAHCDAIRDVTRVTSDDEYDYNTIAEWEPRSLGQCRLKVLWRRQWQRADGSLYPVPEQVWVTDKYGFSRQVDARAVA